jgi:Tol biopolymer transport system component
VSVRSSNGLALVAQRARWRLALVAALLLAAGFAVGAALGREASSKTVGTIVFQSDRAGDVEIYTMRADGSGAKRLTRSRGLDVVPAWSPNGRKIAFTSERDGNREVYVMNADGSKQRRLTHNPRRDLFPTWSPDGQSVAFVREGKRSTFEGPIYIIRADGGGERELTKAGGADCCLAWSPDGNWIAYVSHRLEISLLRSDGSTSKQLTRNRVGDCCPAWSPAGSKIAFASERAGDSRFKIYVMNADGTRQKRVSSFLGIRPSFSPNGKRLAFSGLPPGARMTSKSIEIYVTGATGGSTQRLTRTKAEDAFPQWRPTR